jgi:hypothetical protein
LPAAWYDAVCLLAEAAEEAKVKGDGDRMEAAYLGGRGGDVPWQT